jgi:hypothetical protein
MCWLTQSSQLLQEMQGKARQGGVVQMRSDDDRISLEQKQDDDH